MHETQTFLDLNCSQSITNEDDLDEWNRVPLENKHFKCANVSNEFCQIFVVILGTEIVVLKILANLGSLFVLRIFNKFYRSPSQLY